MGTTPTTTEWQIFESALESLIDREIDATQKAALLACRSIVTAAPLMYAALVLVRAKFCPVDGKLWKPVLEAMDAATEAGA